VTNIDHFTIYDFSENILLIEIKNISEYSDSTEIYIALSEHLRKSSVWREVVTAEESIAITYNSIDISSSEAGNMIRNQIKRFRYFEGLDKKSILSVPVYYSEEFGLDLQDIASENSLTIDEISNLHSQDIYKVKMIGFTPGFAYLGDLPTELFTTRLSAPRVSLAPGSVGISGNRTGIYALGGPGGWKIIGRTPLDLFNKNKKNPFVILPGMEVRFEPITKQQYKKFNN